ncbi:hypothetical protein DFH06DRAFT_619916 [Mycena polygramma]|nr:hypothetical protein DFH06DRAFT_619916 [Mycena polygramma]
MVSRSRCLASHRFAVSISLFLTTEQVLPSVSFPSLSCSLRMSGIFVIVDDQDPSLTYSPGWSPSPSENEFQFAGTMTAPAGLTSVGSTVTYEFEGTSISVFGLTRADSSKPNMTLEFAIDGVFQQSATLQPHQFESFHSRFFESSTLGDGQHSLEITIGSINTTNVLLDYLIYEASQNATLDSSAQILVLNTSPQLAYSQGWSTGITGLRSGLIEQAISLNNSVEGAADLGATVALNFTGNRFEVRGLLVQQWPSPVAAYSLDGGPWTDVQMPTNGSSYFNAQSNFQFIGQTFNSVDTHSLVITPRIAGAFFVDFITVQSPTAFLPPKANIAPPPDFTSSISSSKTSPTLSQPLLPTASTDSGTFTPRRLHTGAIVGICIAIAACLCIAVLGVVLLHRRRRRRTTTSQPSASPSMSDVTRSNITNESAAPFFVAPPGRARKGQRFVLPREDSAVMGPPAYAV